MQCIPAEEGVVHLGHSYIPQDEEDSEACGGVLIPAFARWGDRLETRASIEYRLAMWVTIDGIKMLHKTNNVLTLLEARKQLADCEDDFLPGTWFIVKDIVETQTFTVD